MDKNRGMVNNNNGCNFQNSISANGVHFDNIILKLRYLTKYNYSWHGN